MRPDLRVGWRNRDQGLVEEPQREGRPYRAHSATERRVVEPYGPHSTTEQPLVDPVAAQLDRLAAQINAVQQQLDALITRRNAAVGERASHHVAAIVAAAETSAADMTAAAAADAATLRDNLVAEAQGEVQMIRAEAEIDAARIRTEAHAHAVRVREKALVDASSEIEAVCERLTDELRAGARAAKADMDSWPNPAGNGSSPLDPQAGQQTSAQTPPAPPVIQMAGEVRDAVDELQSAAETLEESFRFAVRTPIPPD